MRNKPTLPNNVAQSQIVGVYIAQLDGTKSRCRLVTTMTKRSIHMPMFTDERDEEKRDRIGAHASRPERLRDQTLNSISAQKTQPYGPNARLAIMNCSKTSPLYQAMNASMM